MEISLLGLQNLPKAKSGKTEMHLQDGGTRFLDALGICAWGEYPALSAFEQLQNQDGGGVRKDDVSLWLLKATEKELPVEAANASRLLKATEKELPVEAANASRLLKAMKEELPLTLKRDLAQDFGLEGKNEPFDIKNKTADDTGKDIFPISDNGEATRNTNFDPRFTLKEVRTSGEMNMPIPDQTFAAPWGGAEIDPGKADALLTKIAPLESKSPPNDVPVLAETAKPQIEETEVDWLKLKNQKKDKITLGFVNGQNDNPNNSAHSTKEELPDPTTRTAQNEQISFAAKTGPVTGNRLADIAKKGDLPAQNSGAGNENIIVESAQKELLPTIEPPFEETTVCADDATITNQNSSKNKSLKIGIEGVAKTDWIVNDNGSVNAPVTPHDTNGTGAISKSFHAGVIDQIIEKTTNARVNLKTGQTEVKIDLKPEFLGQMRMQITTADHQVMVKILTENPLAKQIIESNLHQLTTALQGQGLQIDQFEVNIGYGQSHNPNQPDTPSFLNSGERAQENTTDSESVQEWDGERSEFVKGKTELGRVNLFI